MDPVIATLSQNPTPGIYSMYVDILSYQLAYSRYTCTSLTGGFFVYKVCSMVCFRYYLKIGMFAIVMQYSDLDAMARMYSHLKD